MTSVGRVEPTRVGRRYSPHPAALVTDSSPAAGARASSPKLPELDTLLAAAASNVCASWEREGRDGHTSDEVAAPLVMVSHALKRAIDGEAIEVTGLPPTLASRRMVDLFRRAVVARLDEE